MLLLTARWVGGGICGGGRRRGRGAKVQHEWRSAACTIANQQPCVSDTHSRLTVASTHAACTCASCLTRPNASAAFRRDVAELLIAARLRRAATCAPQHLDNRVVTNMKRRQRAAWVGCALAVD